MALISYPPFLQTRTYSAQQVRHALAQMIPREGIVGRGDFAVSQRAAGANMSVDVAAGEAWVKGDSTARQGYYHLTNDALANVSVPAANGTNPRVDLLVARVNDSTITGPSDVPTFEVAQGTATPGATLANLTNPGVPPSTAIPLAYILVPAGATSVLNANIGYLPKSDSAGIGAVAGAPSFYAFHYPWGLGPPSVRIRRSTSQSIPDTAETVITGLNVESTDLNQMHDTAVNDSRITFQVPGYYRIAATVLWEPQATPVGFRRLFIRKNGEAANIASALIKDAHSTLAHPQYASTTFRFQYGDYIEMVVAQNSGGALDATGGVENGNVLEASWQGR